MLNPTKAQVISRIHFIEKKISSLDKYLPETYNYLMRELDVQKRILAELEIEETYATLDGRQNR
jgi:hypothetical protein